MHTKSQTIGNDNWALWFAIVTPIIGALLGMLGIFVLAR
jgi:glycerol uptake facilitator-like aquaporin